MLLDPGHDTVPYHGIMISHLTTQIREMQVLDNCTQKNGYHSFGIGSGHGIKDTINTSIRSIEDQYCGSN